jgi:hypothetical protein
MSVSVEASAAAAAKTSYYHRACGTWLFDIDGPPYGEGDLLRHVPEARANAADGGIRGIPMPHCPTCGLWLYYNDNALTHI